MAQQGSPLRIAKPLKDWEGPADRMFVFVVHPYDDDVDIELQVAVLVDDDPAIACNSCAFQVNFDELERLETDWSLSFRKRGTNTLHGPYNLWHSGDRKQLRQCSCFKDGSLNGPTFEWFVDGQKRLEAFYKENVFVGPYHKRWWENGNKRSVQHLNDDGELDGPSTFWASNGDIMEERYFDKSQPVGVWWFYLEGGSCWYGHDHSTGERVDCP